MKKLNNQGFTLVELLAVIVVLALLMVVATSSIGGALNNAKKNSLKTEAQKMLTAAYSDAKASYMLSSNLNNMVNAGATSSAAVYWSTAWDDSTGGVVRYKDGDYYGWFKFEDDYSLTSYCIFDDANKLAVSHKLDASASEPEDKVVSFDDSDTSTTPKISDNATYNKYCKLDSGILSVVASSTDALSAE